MTMLEQTQGLHEDATDLGGRGSVSDYIALLKPRVMSLVVFTAAVGLVMAPGNQHPVLSFISILCIAIGGGASGALNMWWDADIDAIMSRTKKRPIPAGKITRQEAFAFGMILSFGSVLTLGLVANWMAAGLLAFTIFFYVVIYTMWLKRSTPQNIVIGGAAGALPPMVGWAAVTGDVTLVSIALFMITFTWTPPHFWALALVKNGDYQAAGVPMLPVVAGETATRHQIVLYSLLLLPVGMAPYFLGFASVFYGVGSAMLGLVFLGYAIRVWRVREGDAAKKTAMSLFKFSLFYLMLIFAGLLAENMISLV
ncbi:MULTISPECIES: heme o synthase [unclassified Pseudovibrio]|uniref:heme o synthase n=1 Tax=unclassified Pseudovibrio TaxID=2627060 RepID=UPI0007AE3F81|nr:MULTISPECIES: heme o synthase [unclassified Pseudovibrio]KZL27255.1 Protoheme IX farnesyltransferase [Pseudovibrio sp. Ad37]KZL29280.1 Protoheme IX farnesyltransferase [Pseudovibrio sp. WM33]